MVRWWAPLDEEREDLPPAEWWGRFGEPPHAGLSLVDLVRLGSLDTATAAFLWLALEQRASVFVAARAHGVGKTTLLTALVDLLPEGTQRYYLRGWYERFAFVETLDRDRAYLLVNEISDHLPIYLWGKGVRRVFELVAAGWRLGATVHASGAEEVFALLGRFPLDVPAALLGGIDLVVTLDASTTTEGTLRRVVRIEAVRSRGQELATRLLAQRETIRSPLAVYPAAFLATAEERFGIPVERASRELAWRQRRIARWVSEGISGRRAFQTALARWRADSTERVVEPPPGSRIEGTAIHNEALEERTEVEESAWRDRER